jgi:hypothetical protein
MVWHSRSLLTSLAPRETAMSPSTVRQPSAQTEPADHFLLHHDRTRPYLWTDDQASGLGCQL